MLPSVGHSGFPNGQSPGSEDIEPAYAKHKRRSCLSVKKIQDADFG